MANGVMSNAGRSLRDTIQSIPGEKRIAIVVLAAMLLAGIAGLVYWGQQKEYAVLYSDLTQETAGSITSELDQQGVPYQVTGGGEIVKVPKGQVSRLRLNLAEKGLPSGERAGYSLFDDQEMVGMSQFTQQLNKQRALEGELERTINGLEGVSTARVHLVMPEKALFEKDQESASASVTLHLGSGSGPDDASVQGVAHMVASAVEGLERGQVTIVDQNGEVLHGEEEKDRGLGGGSGREEAMAFKRNLESRMEQELTSLVERIVGRNRAEVRVNADIDEKEVRLHEEEYDPFGQVARSEQLRTRNQKQPGQPGGQAGAEANVPGGGGGGESEGEGETVLREKVTNYEISKTVRDVTEPGGGVERLSVAVLVDGEYVQGDEGEEQFQPRSEESINDIQALVSDAAGIDQERGDQVTVRSLQMQAADAAPGQEAEAVRLQDFYLQLVKYGGYALVTLLILWFVVRPLMRYLTSAGATTGYPVPAGGGGTDGLEGVIPEEYQGMEEGELPPEVRQRVNEERQRMANQMKASEERQRTEQERRSHVVDMINSDVDAATSVIRQWMREHTEQEG